MVPGWYVSSIPPISFKMNACLSLVIYFHGVSPPPSFGITFAKLGTCGICFLELEVRSTGSTAEFSFDPRVPKHLDSVSSTPGAALVAVGVMLGSIASFLEAPPAVVVAAPPTCVSDPNPSWLCSPGDAPPLPLDLRADRGEEAGLATGGNTVDDLELSGGVGGGPDDCLKKQFASSLRLIKALQRRIHLLVSTAEVMVWFHNLHASYEYAGYAQGSKRETLTQLHSICGLCSN